MCLCFNYRFSVKFLAFMSVYCHRSCYVVFPCQQIVLALGCLMGLVMFARYGEDSPLDKGYVKTNDQVRLCLTLFSVIFLKDAFHGLFLYYFIMPQ